MYTYSEFSFCSGSTVGTDCCVSSGLPDWGRGVGEGGVYMIVSESVE